MVFGPISRQVSWAGSGAPNAVAVRVRSVRFDNVLATWPPVADSEDCEARRQESARVSPRETHPVSNWTLACECLNLRRWPESEKRAA